MMESFKCGLMVALGSLLCPLSSSALAQKTTAPVKAPAPSRADSPEGRIKAAPLPAPGKECATDDLAAEEEAKLPEQKRLRAFQEVAMHTIQTAEEIADTYWDGQEQEFFEGLQAQRAEHVKNRKGAHFDGASNRRAAWLGAMRNEDFEACTDEFCTKPTKAGRFGRQSLRYLTLPQQVCQRLASQDPEFCKDMGLGKGGFAKLMPKRFKQSLPQMCAFMQIVGKDKKKRKKSKDGSHCDMVEGWQRTMCVNWHRDGEIDCGVFKGMEAFSCQLFKTMVSDKLPYCGRNLNPIGCLVALMWTAGSDGVKACDRLENVAGANTREHRLLRIQCRAIVAGEPGDCPRGYEDLKGDHALDVMIDAMLRGGSRGVQPVVGVIAATPSACAVNIEVLEGDVPVARQVVATRTSARPVERAMGKSMALTVKPFEHRVNVSHACVPTVGW